MRMNLFLLLEIRVHIEIKCLRNRSDVFADILPFSTLAVHDVDAFSVDQSTDLWERVNTPKMAELVVSVFVAVCSPESPAFAAFQLGFLEFRFDLLTERASGEGKSLA
jgi:hypothetical protein